MELIVGVIAAAFVVLVVFAVRALLELSKTLKKTEKTLSETHKLLNELSEPTLGAVYNANKLLADIRKKTEALDVLFIPLYALKKDKHEPKIPDQIAEIIGFVSQGIQLFKIIKKEFN